MDDAISELADSAFSALAAMVREPSTVGYESGAQEVLAGELAAAGFTIERLAIPDDIGDDPAAGVPRQSYAGRYDIIGQRGSRPDTTDSSKRRSLIVNGHMDVVPAAEAGWTTPPFHPAVRDGWMHGRGAGDMKGGFAAGLLAIGALDIARPGWLGDGSLTFVAAIEEEYTGNGTLAACRAGHLAEAALLLEPTDLTMLLAGVGIIWVEITVEGQAGHAESAAGIVNPIQECVPILQALTRLEQRMNEEHGDTEDADPAFASVTHPYTINVGELHAGDWASSVPASARIEVRVGHPGRWDSQVAFDEVQSAVADACAENAWLAAHPPLLRLSGFRAQRYAQPASGELIETLSRAHQEAHGTPPAPVAMGSTTDARYYLNQYGIPAVAYGPRTRNIHGIDEAVELNSIVDTALTVSRFLLAWFGVEGDRP